ncbi:hypothetical protein MVEN_01275200 [Mycena venus]|uniref:EH domain-containing protein n=1 Tax=Mycena venus TaxID=2733690 RepID=A0A8H6Y2U2_9AGAR|nr:hypothetical protein MVEN_01275200 [Mycena venus]
MAPTFTPSAEESALVSQLFARGEPHKLGVLTGDVALDLFSQTNLSVQVLSDIWSIADKDGHGWLSPTQTAVAVRLIGWAQPALLPTFRMYLAHKLVHLGISPPLIPPLAPGDKAKFHRLFVGSSPVDGLIDGDRAREIFSKSKLSAEQLSQIWELADTEHRGALDSTGFTIALHLIQGLMNNRFSTVPAFLPNELALADPKGDGKLTRDGFATALFLIDERRRGNAIPAAPPLPPKTPNIPQFNGKLPQPQYPPEKVANGQLSSNDNLQRQPSHLRQRSLGDNLQQQPPYLRYPPLPLQSNNTRFSSLWTPDSQPNFQGPLTSPTTPTPPSAPPDAVAQLTRQVHEMQKLIMQLRQSHVEKATTIANLTHENASLRVKVVHEVLVKENEALRTSVQELKETVQQLQAGSSEVEMQRIQYDDLVRENERLNNRVKEMHESTTQLPWSGGDSELQTLINEDLARENARLRTEAREMQENVAQLQEATSGYEEQRRLNAELTRERESVWETTIRTMQTSLDAQRREVGQLSREVDRLKTQLRSNARAAPTRRDTDIPPPAYDEFGTTVVA